MANSINLSLTEELRAFVDRNCGEHGLYATPSEFVRDLLREKKQRQDAAAIRDGVLQGYRDLIDERSVAFHGSLTEALKEADEREKSGW